MTDDQEVQGDILSAKNGMVVIKTKASRQLVSLEKFSDADRAYILQNHPQARKQPKPKGQAPAKKASQPKPPTAQPVMVPGHQPKSLARQSYRSVAPEIRIEGLTLSAPPPQLKAKLPGSPTLHSIESLRGKLVLVVIRRGLNDQFLKQDLAILKQMYEHYHPMGLEIIELVTHTRSAKKIDGRVVQIGFTSGKYRRTNDVAWYLRPDQQGLIAKGWGVQTPHPVYILVDKNGLVAGAYPTAQGLSYHIDKHLGINQ